MKYKYKTKNYNKSNIKVIVENVKKKTKAN